ncbi:hypothetical protein JD969_17665 [Planctomycetota bacterium]|nr:hypothetical protein JD969_17665 [Planctomycetota bacterium]
MNFFDTARNKSMKDGHAYYIEYDELESKLVLFTTMSLDKRSPELTDTLKLLQSNGAPIELEFEIDNEFADERIFFNPDGSNTPASIRVLGHPNTEFIISADSYYQPFELTYEESS